MNSAATSVRRRIAATLSALALGVTGIATALPAAAAPDPDVRGEATVSDATFTWGVKQSFRNYLSSPIAHGTVTTLGTTTQNPSTGQFIWPGGAGTISTDGTSGSIGFGAGNGVRFQGHQMQGGHALDMTFTNPRVVLTSDTTGELRVDAQGFKFESMTAIGPEYFLPDVKLANLDLSGATIGGTSISVLGAPATLAAEGVEAFGGFYGAGEALDPISLTGTVSVPIPDPEPEPEPVFDPLTVVEVMTADAVDGLTVQVSGEGYVNLPTPTTGAAPAGVYVAVIDHGAVEYEDVGQNNALAVAFVPGGTAAWSQIRDGAPHGR